MSSAKSLPALDESFLSGVNLLVFGKTVVLAKDLAALVACVGLLTGVDSW